MREIKTFKWHTLNESSIQRKPRVRRVSFGDGYEQRAVDGLNSNLSSYSVRFRERSAVIDEIERFLVEHAGVKSFYYRQRSSDDFKLCVCEDWSRVDIDFQSSELSATFREVVQ